MNTYSYKNFAYYGKNHSKDYLSKKLDKYAPCDLAHMLVSNKIWDGTIKTEHELSCATEELDEWLSNWPEDEGFGSSDRYYNLKRIDEMVTYQRAFHHYEEKYAKINNHESAPRFDDVYAFMVGDVADAMIKIFNMATCNVPSEVTFVKMEELWSNVY